MRQTLLTRLSVTAFAAVLFLVLIRPGSAIADGVKITDLGDRLRVEIGGKLFTEYHYKNVPRPFLYPVLGVGDAAMTRNWPIKEVGNEETDHPHHKSLWYAHGDINGQDFWSEQKGAGKTVHVKFLDVKSGDKQGVICAENNWVADDGKLVCTDTRTLTFHNRSPERVMDFEIALHASQGPITLGDTKEGSMAIRVASTMNVKGKWGRGHIVNSEGVRDGATWGKRAAWCDYYGPVGDKTVGVAIFDHPSNPKHPTWWHVRDYGLFGANPFGVHDFEKKPKGTGDIKVEAGKSLTWRYRFLFHEGDEQQGQVAQRYDEFTKAK